MAIFCKDKEETIELIGILEKMDYDGNGLEQFCKTDGIYLFFGKSSMEKKICWSDTQYKKDIENGKFESEKDYTFMDINRFKEGLEKGWIKDK